MESKEEIELYKKIALRVKTLRQVKGITLADFLSETGIHIGRIERGERYPTIATLNKICKHLNTNLGEFFRALESYQDSSTAS